eukprot:scaffold54296_cov26-Tisochrysis_lutea.AAC.2
MHTKQPRDQRSARKSVPLLLIACEGGAAEEAERKTNIAKYDRHQDPGGGLPSARVQSDAYRAAQRTKAPPPTPRPTIRRLTCAPGQSHLRSHVVWRSDKVFELVAQAERQAQGRIGLNGVHQLGGSEVDELRTAFAREQHVLRLHVAMDDVPLVEVLQRLGNLRGPVGGMARVDAPPVAHCPELPTWHELEGHVQRRRVLECVEQLDDGRVVGGG